MAETGECRCLLKHLPTLAQTAVISIRPMPTSSIDMRDSFLGIWYCGLGDYLLEIWLTELAIDWLHQYYLTSLFTFIYYLYYYIYYVIMLYRYVYSFGKELSFNHLVRKTLGEHRYTWDSRGHVTGIPWDSQWLVTGIPWNS